MFKAKKDRKIVDELPTEDFYSLTSAIKRFSADNRIVVPIIKICLTSCNILHKYGIHFKPKSCDDIIVTIDKKTGLPIINDSIVRKCFAGIPEPNCNCKCPGGQAARIIISEVLTIYIGNSVPDITRELPSLGILFPGSCDGNCISIAIINNSQDKYWKY